MNVEFKITGLDDVLPKMRRLGPALQKRGLKNAVRAGANIVRAHAVNNAHKLDRPETPNAIWKNIASQFASKLSKREGGVAYRVGVMGGGKNPGGRETTGKGPRGGSTWYWRFIELGTSRIRAQPFMRPALADNTGRVTDMVVRTLNTEIDKEIKNLERSTPPSGGA